jgi:hypothetical protein
MVKVEKGGIVELKHLVRLGSTPLHIDELKTAAVMMK